MPEPQNIAPKTWAISAAIKAVHQECVGSGFRAKSPHGGMLQSLLWHISTAIEAQVLSFMCSSASAVGSSHHRHHDKHDVYDIHCYDHPHEAMHSALFWAIQFLATCIPPAEQLAAGK